MIIEIALLVARAYDEFAVEFVEGHISVTLERIVKESMTNRARLLHCFPLRVLITRNHTKDRRR